MLSSMFICIYLWTYVLLLAGTQRFYGLMTWIRQWKADQ